MNKKNYFEISISPSATLTDALKQMDRLMRKLLFVIEEGKFISVLSLGDIQRALIKNLSLETAVKNVLRSEITISSPSDSFEEIKRKMYAHRIECMPVVDDKNNLLEVYFWEEVFGKESEIKNVNLNLPVVIMAGGQGTRLKPLTNVLPKPLLPIGEKTIIEEIMDKFVKVGCGSFFISVNYRSDLIKHYFDSLNNKDYSIKYFQESRPLGTAGSMYLIKSKIKSTFFVSNCDIIVNQDLDDIYQYHIENGNCITIVSALKHYKIPYGTIETCEDGILTSLSEKPELTFQINTGMYILEPDVLDYIEDDTFLHITELIECIKENGKRVGVFPVNEGAWKDIGEWDEYLKIIR